MKKTTKYLSAIPLGLVLAGCGSFEQHGQEQVAESSAAVVANPYSNGLGDHQNSIHLYLQYRNDSFHDSRGIVFTTFDQALDMMRQARNFSNGSHIVEYAYGWEKGAAEGTPYFLEDTLPPFDGGFAEYKALTAAATNYNANIASYLDTWLAGPATGSLPGSSSVPASVRSHAADGSWKVGFTDDPCPSGSPPCPPHLPVNYYAISLQNSISSGQEWPLLDNAVNNAGVGFAVFEDGLGQAHIENEAAVAGSTITTFASERAAGKTEIQHLWDTYGISTMTEYTYPEWQGLVPWFWGIEGSQASTTLSSDDKYLNVWKNSAVFMHRVNSSGMRGLAWGSENGRDYLVLRAPSSNSPAGGDPQSIDDLRLSFFKNGLQYLYMQKFSPISCASPSGSAGGCSVDSSKTVVTFSDAVSTLTSTAANVTDPYPGYSLVQTFAGGRTFTLASSGDRFVPQVGAGLKIIAYKASGGSRTWALPPSWDQVSQVDTYELTSFDAPLYKGSISVAAGHQLTLSMPDNDSAFVLVPQGAPVTPTGVLFGTLNNGSALTTFGGVAWNTAGNAPAKVQAPGPATGFSSKSVSFDSTSQAQVSEQVGLPSGGIFHSLRVGNAAGTGSLTFHSSNAQNADVTMALPPAGQTALIETNWQFAETAKLTWQFNNSSGANNVFFNYLSYSAPQAPLLNAAEGGDGSVTLRFGGQHYDSYKVKVGTSSGNYTSTTAVANAGTFKVNNLPRETQHFFAVSGVTAGVDSTNSNELSGVAIDYSTVRAEDKLANGVAVTGNYGGINWGSAAPLWRSWAPFGGVATRSVYIDSSSTGLVSKTITLPASQVLRSLRLGRTDNPGNAIVTLTSSIAGNAPQTITLTQTNRGQEFKTGWQTNVQGSTSTVTISVSFAGQAANVVFDDIKYEDDFPVVNFQDFPTNATVIADWYQGIDWGTASPSWKSSGPFGALTTISSYIDSNSTGPVSKTIGLHAGKVLARLRLGRTVGAADATVVLHSTTPGNVDKTFTVTSANSGQMFETSWRKASSGVSSVTITVTFSAKALNVGFDDLVYTDGDASATFEEYPAFNTYPAANRPIDGTSNAIEWGTAPPWRSFGPFAALTTTSAYIDSSSTNAANFFSLRPGKVLKSVRLGRVNGASDATVVLHSSVGGNTDKSFLITSANNGSVFATGWLAADSASSTVTATVSYAGGVYNVGFDDLVFGNP